MSFKELKRRRTLKENQCSTTNDHFNQNQKQHPSMTIPGQAYITNLGQQDIQYE